MKYARIILLALLPVLGFRQAYAQQFWLTNIDSLLQVLSHQKEDTNKVNLLNLLANTYYLKTNCDEGLKYGEQGLQLASKLGWEYGIAEAKSALGIVYYCKSDYPKSLSNYFAALKIYERLGNRNGIATVYRGLGIVYAEQKDYANALAYYSWALPLHKETGDKRGYGVTNVRMGAIYSDVIKDYPKALAHFLEGLRAFEEMNYKNGIANVYGNMGNAYSAMGNYVMALSYLQRALVMINEMNHRVNRIYAYCGIADVYLALALDTAKHGNAHIPGPEAGSMRVPIVPVPTGRAEQIRLSIDYLQRAHDSAVIVGIPSVTQLTCEKLANAYYASGDYKQAMDNYRDFAATRDSIFSKDNEKKMMQVALQYDNDKVHLADSLKNKEKEKIYTLELHRQRSYTMMAIAGVLLVVGFSFFIFKERTKSEKLLLNILPAEVAEELKAKGSAEAKLIDEVTVLFTDFKGFTQLSEKLSPKELVGEINNCFSAFDNIMHKYGVEKIKTIGDAYMAAGGLPTPNKTHAEDVVKAALEIQDFMRRHKEEREAAGKLFFEIRIGVHTGPVVAGIVGIKKFAYDIWGDTVNTASRMESSGAVGKVNVSETTYELVKDKFTCEYRGEVEAKGKGVMKMYFVS